MDDDNQQPDDKQSDDEQQAGDDQKPESRFQRIYAIVFLPLFLAVVGGVVCVLGGQEAIATENDRHLHTGEDGKMDWFVIFRIPGLQDWRLQFVIGAVLGAVCGIVFCIRFWSRKDGDDIS